ncbi:MAG: family 20 glycosylhydrolase [Planctomycetes bacterium]|nr:family 20 glycosylhydrolase [Planctomycetota bacterium]
MDQSPLLPRPQRILYDPGSFELGAPRLTPERAASPVRTALDALAAEVAPRARGRKLDISSAVDGALRAEGYRLVAGSDGVRIEHADEAGLAHALQTLTQWVRAHAASGAEIPGLAVLDWPDFAERGVMLDVSRDRVPRTEELHALVAKLAEWKCNRLQLYMEAAFAHPSFEPAWRGTSPFTADELRALDDHCAAHGIELVPNQQSFGHLHRYLVHDEWRGLAECPGGVEHPFSSEREPFSLCPGDPGALAFLEELYDGLLPCFRSQTVNVGLDETFDLGLGRSAQACAERGKQTVYLEFLREVHALVSARGMRMQFWADIVLGEPERVRELPADAIAMAWGYDAAHPFDRELRTLAASGLEFHVCPGTSSWNAVGGRVENARVNLESATAAALEHGARGVLITDWGDRGHHQPPLVSFFGFAVGLGSAWNAGARATSEQWAELVDLHALGGTDFLGAALLELGRLDDHNAARSENGSALFYTLAFAHEGWPHPRIPALDVEGAERSAAAARSLAERLRAYEPPTPEAGAYRDELEWAARLLEVGARLGAARCRTPERALHELDAAANLAEDLDALISRHRELWLRRSRSGGLERSASVLQRVVDALRAG